MLVFREIIIYGIVMAASATPFQPYDKIDDSRFMKRITDQDLKRDVERIVDSATDIAGYVVQDMPQFTDHGERHFLNVLSYMEYLAGENVKKMSQLECALAVMAAYTHDLGMVFSLQEKAEMAKESGPCYDAWRTFLETHSLKPRFDRATDHGLRAAITAQVRTDFLRRSHTDFTLTPSGDRISEWLKSIRETPSGSTSHAPTFSFHGFDYLQALAWLGLSHGQPIYWLQQRMAKGADGFRVVEKDITDHQPVASESVHWLYLSWLLRLADVVDLDASRTPPVLFDHIGIENHISKREWLKHLALPKPPEFNHPPDSRTLHYTCGTCPAPEVERAIVETISWINDEIAKVRSAQDQYRSERLHLELPSKADYHVTTRTGGYIYQDVEFSLQRDAVMELLMGEALYGEPTLALRELVQNALDALQMRKLRDDLRKTLRKAGKPFAHLRVDPVEADEELKVQVTWGTETAAERAGRRFIRVTDNGTGMDLASVRRFLTQIGRSYYKSDAYLREVEEMRQHGILCTTISQFGIGFLSSFMLADHITVRTRTAGADPDDLPLDSESPEQQEKHVFPLRVEIDSTHGLIAVYSDTVRASERKSCDQCGTEVTLWLKPEFDFAACDPDLTMKKLRRHFYEVGNSNLKHEFKASNLEPTFEVASYIVWPLFPVELHPLEDSSAMITLDDTFHFRSLLSLDGKAFAIKAKELEISLSASDTDLQWHFCDWIDCHRDEKVCDFKGTGSRVRLAIVRTGPQSRRATPAEWTTLGDTQVGHLAQSLRNMFVEAQLPLSFRSPVIIAGVRVPEEKYFKPLRELASSVGAVLWLDLRGGASPRLRADRQGTTRAQPPACPEAITNLQRQWRKQWGTVQPPVSRWANHSIARLQRARVDGRNEWRLPFGEARVSVLGVVQEAKLARNLGLFDSTLIVALARHLARDPDLAHGLTFGLGRARNLDLDNTFATVDSLVRASANTRPFNLDRDCEIDFVRVFYRARDRARRKANYGAFLEMAMLSETFWPSLELAFAPVALEGTSGALGDLHLLGPLHLASANHAANNNLPDWLESYHLCSPLTGVPLSALRRASASPSRGWIEQRWQRTLFTLPFLYGGESAYKWRKMSGKITTILGTDHLLLLLPHPEVMEKSFSEFTTDDLARCATALWDISTGRVVYADGVHNRKQMLGNGRSLKKWANG